MASVHRLIEQQAVSHSTTLALISELGGVTYRDLNLRANAVARRLIANGLRRSATVVVRSERSVDTATVLLAVLKAGAAYRWVDPANDSTWPSGVSVCEATGEEECWRNIDLRSLLDGTTPAPNLPVLTRPTDVACVMSRPGGGEVLVPHHTLTTLRRDNVRVAEWRDDADAFGLWAGLISGATVSLGGQPLHVAAA